MVKNSNHSQKMSSGAGISEETSKTQPQTGRRLMMGAVVLLAGAVVILIAGVVLMQGEIASLRSTLEEFKPPEGKVTRPLYLYNTST